MTETLLRETSQRSVPVTLSATAWTQVLPNNPHRIGLLISPQAGDSTFNFTWDPSSGFPFGGFSVISGVVLVLLLVEIGSIITQPLYANDNGGGATIEVQEIIDMGPLEASNSPFR